MAMEKLSTWIVNLVCISSYRLVGLYLIYLLSWPMGGQGAKQSLFEYIEVFYNRRRRHSYLGYISPVKYERRYASH